MLIRVFLRFILFNKFFIDKKLGKFVFNTIFA